MRLALAGLEMRAEAFAQAETAALDAVAALQRLPAPPEGMLAAAQALVRDARDAQGLQPLD